MGFFDFVVKMVKGEPIFSDPGGTRPIGNKPPVDPHLSRSITQTPAAPSRIDAHGNKYLPEVTMSHVESHLHDARVEVWVTFRNESPFVMQLDEVQVFGHETVFHCDLRPRAQRAFRVYSGPKFVHDSYHIAELYYHDIETGDYFCARHAIEYKYEHDHTYTPEQFRLLRPIRDV